MSITVTQLSQELNVNHSGLHRKVKQLGLKTFRRVVDDRRHLTLKPEDAQRLRETFAEIVHEQEDWVGAEAAARMTGYGSAAAFLQARYLGKITVARRQVAGQSGRRTVYDPADLRRIAAARPVRPHGMPRGTLTTPQMQALVGVWYSMLARWADQGCPHGLLVNGNRYWRPAEVLGWLERTEFKPRTSSQRRAGRAAQIERLRAHLAQERVA